MDLNSDHGGEFDERDMASDNSPLSEAAGQAEGQAQEAGPTAHGDPMGTPAADERVLWKGRPDPAVLARSAFHTRKVAAYFAVLAGLAFAFGSFEKAMIVVGLGALGVGVLTGLAHLSARTSLYILTDVRLILRIGMAIETRINVPLKHISAANLKSRGKGFGDIAMELKGERLLGYFLLWPHVRPFQYTRPQPMLRGVPDAETVAHTLAEARAQYGAIDRAADQTTAPTGPQATAKPASGRQAQPTATGGLEGAPA